MNEKSPSVTVNIGADTSELDEAIKKAEKFKSLLQEGTNMKTMLISQDGYKAIAREDISLYFISPTPERAKEYNKPPDKYTLMVQTNRLYDSDPFHMFDFFAHKNVEVVKAVMRFLATGTFLFDGSTDAIVVDLPTLYKLGLPMVEPMVLE